MNRRKFFQSLGFAAIFAPIIGLAKKNKARRRIPKGWEGPFYGVDFGSPGKDIYLVEYRINGKDYYFSNCP